MCRSRSIHPLRSAALVTVAALALAGCAKETAPKRLHSITGHVRVIGYLTAEDSHFLGTRVVDNASGVRVDLLLGTRVVATTTTVNGTYRFENLEPGGYQARGTAMGALAPVTTTLTIATVDIVARDTLRLASQGDLYPAPNPIVDTTLVVFQTSVQAPVRLDVVDATGAVVAHLVVPNYPIGPGLLEATWDGLTLDGTPAPIGIYWAYFVSGTDVRCQAIFRDALHSGAPRVREPHVRVSLRRTARTPFPSPSR